MENSTGTPPTVAGWYDDPDDANFIRYSNGRYWGERVPKERNLTFNTDKVYRPGGVSKREEATPAAAPELKSDYQPLTRRERREREKAEQLHKGVPIAIDNDLEFEFQTAQPTTKSYVRNDDEAPASEELADAPLSLPSLEAAEPAEGTEEPEPFIVVEDEAEFDLGDFPPLALEETEDDDQSSLPELDFSGIGAPTADDENEGAEDLPEAHEEPPALPSLSFDEEDDTADSADSEPDESDFEWASPKEAHYVPVDEADNDFFSDSDLASDDKEALLDDGEIEIVIPPHAENEGSRRSYERPQPVEEASPAAKVEEAKKEPEAAPTADEAKADESEDSVSGFGFASKLSKWQNDEPEANPEAEEAPAEAADEPESKTTALPAVQAESTDEKADDDSDNDEDEDDADEEQRAGLKDRFRSFFSRNKNDDDVLEEDEDDDTDDASDEAVADEQPKAAPKRVVSEPAEGNEDDHEDEIPVEEPQLKAGLFSSRQEKEDAATEVELLSRLQEVAIRVAALKKEEKELSDRVAKAKQEEKEINDRIVHAHEEHEVLDNLAKARRIEQHKEHSEKEDDDLLSIIDSHTRPVDIPMDDLIEFEEDESDDDVKTTSKQETEEEETKTNLPQLKF